MKLSKKVATGAILVTGIGLMMMHGAPKHIGPEYLYPNPAYTMGIAGTLNLSDITKSYNGQTYSQAHRNVTTAIKKKVYEEYGVVYPTAPNTEEVDHFYPLCAGGSNDIKNLWLQPAHNAWNQQDFGYHTKDKVEEWGCRMIKAGKLDPKDFYKGVTEDWVNYYLTHKQEIDGAYPKGAPHDE